jgi:hypothetical protein
MVQPQAWEPPGPQVQPPLITIYAPVRRGGRLIARADVRAKGELIELQATASNKLAGRARNWFNRAASWLGRWIKLEGFNGGAELELGRGVFADLPEVAYQLASSPAAIPYDEDVSAGVELYYAAGAGHPLAIEQISNTVLAAAQGDPLALEAVDTLQIIEAAATRRHTLPYAQLFVDAAAGRPEAIKVLAALRETGDGGATRIEWSLDDYEHDPALACGDVTCACADSIGARIVQPRRGDRVRRVRPNLDRPMLYTFQAITAAHGG